jgi:O-antigen ligase
LKTLESPFRILTPLAALTRTIPTAAVVAAGVTTAWVDRGSIAAADWLRYAVLAGLLLATVLFAGSAKRLTFLPVTAVGATCALALWSGLSAAWSPVPPLARDEALLVSLYAVCLALPALTLKSDFDRRAALASIAFALGLMAVGLGVALHAETDLDAVYTEGRLSFPISYANAQAAVLAVGVWPALALAAGRRGHPLVRGAAVGAAAALLAGWLLTQSKGAAIALGLSALVVFALAPWRLRLLVPTALAAVPAFLAFSPLTGPFRARGEPGLGAAIDDAAEALLLVTLVGLVLGLAYAFADLRFELGPRAVRVAGVLVAAAALAALVAGVATFNSRADDPSQWASEKWEAFKHTPPVETGRSHFVNLGSNRYDFWRVAWAEFQEHPAAGIGSRGFAAVYLEEGRSPETPARTHSLPLELLMETGVVGLVLLVLAIGPVLLTAVRRLRTEWGLAALGAGTYWLVHASGDWIFTFPAASIPFFLVAGIVLSDASPPEPLGHRPAAITAAAVATLTLLLFVPPWVSARLSADAVSTGDGSQLGLARTLDPLSVDPYVAEATLAPGPRERIEPLRKAVEKQPRSATLRYLLGTELVEAGRREEGLRELREARRLSPRDPGIRAALER